ncbi:hypothetical protein SELMODRAFT_431066 [Selaginella moellendorffii]|uniref:Uncharacterized protein n=1 Tax=Selaginella moellendorffii TaxID=88036 RepID=D8TBD1_SELML|nr:uncharacterized protein LOC9646160 [Selaginella moellendorffii]EFJ06021.1 hypothetical protein SELMODRAFT_431066 [Selaginella moellendorffii]|eukprot:XP_002992932.1 uncharacterized protein LOC9646160 [Selaginella moellendorffii]
MSPKRALAKLRNLAKWNRSLDPFDYYGVVRTSFPVEVTDEELLVHLHRTLIEARVEAAQRPRPESQFFYVWDTAAYKKFQEIPSERHPLFRWVEERLEQGRIYTTAEEMDQEQGWLPCSVRPSQYEVRRVTRKYLGFESTPEELDVGLADLIQARGMKEDFVERQGLFVTGSRVLIREAVVLPEIWMRLLKYFEESCFSNERVFDLPQLRQVYECEGKPAEMSINEHFGMDLRKDVMLFQPSFEVAIEKLPHSIPDWCDEFPVEKKFWESLPDAEERPWDRKHAWFKLHKPDERRLVYCCDFRAYMNLNNEFDDPESELGKWTRKCLEGGKLYVRDWMVPRRKGLKARKEDVVVVNSRGWKVLPWPESCPEFDNEYPALSRAGWPDLDYCFIVDRYFKEIVFVTGDPAIASEVANPTLRNSLLRRRKHHLLHDIRQVYSCGSEPAPVDLG